MAKVVSINENTKVSSERRAAEAAVPAPRLPASLAIKRAFREEFEVREESATPALAPSTLAPKDKQRPSLWELSVQQPVAKVRNAEDAPMT